MHRGSTLGQGLCAVTLALLVGLSFFGCGSDDSSSEDSGPGGPITLELSGTPTVGYSAGRTTVVVQFVARGKDGVPVSPADVEVEMLVDDDTLDNESVLQEPFVIRHWKMATR